ncbi:N5-carboxyaminoimidazole ribonucleotide synthase [Mariniblastus fucicola]|uniref:N5-carboxyaminoimidazole ribonucleotide synthase n=2 Tax=Mariniblastus fucicola TaxID=980251 RepID=A0A5B9P8R6_9BACT|nr:N5-carboxyaminoimidazole ribonucleotide synthase [Mariniblastus fucicola]
MTGNENSAASPLPEGSTIGLVGGGQLGMFFTQAAQRLGYRVCCFCNHEEEPAAKFADVVVCGAFSDRQAIEELVSNCDVVTYEFESIPPETLAMIAARTRLMPSLEVVQTTQDRALEKTFLREHRIPTSEFRVVKSLAGLSESLQQLNGAAVLKTARDGYDGKGQWKLRGDETPEQLGSIWNEVSDRKCTLERLVDLQKEVSMIVAGDQHGNIKTIGPMCNQHVNHILDTTWVDHSCEDSIGTRTRELSIEIARHFGLVGTFCVEFFINTEGEVLVNEIAPRPHNSGHLTIDAFSLSQFDLQALAVSGHEITEPIELEPAVMVNLLGDLWLQQEPAFEAAADELDCEIFLHLYGKKAARAGRKMGHATIVAESLDAAIEHAKRYRQLLHHRAAANHNS